jgi:Zn-dependent alcohol dehydrogenase
MVRFPPRISICCCAGFESVGAVVAVGPAATRFSAGQPIATVTFGGFSDYAVVDERHAIPVPEATPEMVANLTSGLTASIGERRELMNLLSCDTHNCCFHKFGMVWISCVTARVRCCTHALEQMFLSCSRIKLAQRSALSGSI